MFQSINNKRCFGKRLSELILLNNSSIFDFSNVSEKNSVIVPMPFLMGGRYQTKSINAKCYRDKSGNLRLLSLCKELKDKLPDKLVDKLSKCGLNLNNKSIPTYRVLAVLFGFLQGKKVALSSDTDVHHKDGNPMNNRHDNLEIMSHSDHARHHHYTFTKGDSRSWGMPEVEETSISTVGNTNRYYRNRVLGRITRKHSDRWLRWSKPIYAKIRENFKLGDRVLSKLDTTRQVGEVIGVMPLDSLFGVVVRFCSGRVDIFGKNQLRLARMGA